MKAMNNVRWGTFLKDVLICSLGAYGGPEAHYSVFADQLIVKKRYLDESDLIGLMALTSVLPGPSSTQTIVAIGYKIGGPLLALLTMIVWALPAIIMMTLLSFVSQLLESAHLSHTSLQYIGAMAVGFIILATYRLGKKVLTAPLSVSLCLLGAFVSYLVRTPWVYPLLMFIGAMVSMMQAKNTTLWYRVKLSPPWRYLIVFVGFAIGSVVVTLIWDTTLLHLFESFYRYGYLVIGGGQVVIPMMHHDLIERNHYLTNQEFLTGFGLVQGLPGPMFSFSAYAGGMASRDLGTFYQIIGALLSGIGIFLPGLLLIYFVYPIWVNLQKITGIQVALKGIVPVAVGFMATSAFILMQQNEISLVNLIVMAMTIVLLASRKIAAPIVVVGVLLLGIVVNLYT